MRNNFNYRKYGLMVIFLFLLLNKGAAQTDLDGIMMGKKQLCTGPVYNYSGWKNYWEGTLKRNNLNLGTVSTQTVSLMGSYGVTSKINLLFNVPFVQTKASAGTFSGLKGLQDLSLFLKWKAFERKTDIGTFSLIGVGGVSLPLTNYVADYLPLSIGLRSKTASARLVLDYEKGNFFATASGTYVFRDNIKIDRTSYYTTALHLSNEVNMPNGGNFNFRTGIRSRRLIAEAVFNSWKTFGGFDITKNNAPFPSNKMNATTAGLNFKYIAFPKIEHLSLLAGGGTTIAGRNVGQSTNFYGGFFYILDFNHSTKKNTDHSAKTN